MYIQNPLPLVSCTFLCAPNADASVRKAKLLNAYIQHFLIYAIFAVVRFAHAGEQDVCVLQQHAIQMSNDSCGNVPPACYREAWPLTTGYQN